MTRGGVHAGCFACVAEVRASHRSKKLFCADAEIAATAQNFGQQDDILVLRITRDASGVPRTPEEPVLAMA